MCDPNPRYAGTFQPGGYPDSTYDPHTPTNSTAPPAHGHYSNTSHSYASANASHPQNGSGDQLTNVARPYPHAAQPYLQQNASALPSRGHQSSPYQQAMPLDVQMQQMALGATQEGSGSQQSNIAMAGRPQQGSPFTSNQYAPHCYSAAQPIHTPSPAPALNYIQQNAQNSYHMQYPSNNPGSRQTDPPSTVLRTSNSASPPGYSSSYATTQNLYSAPPLSGASPQGNYQANIPQSPYPPQQGQHSQPPPPAPYSPSSATSASTYESYPPPSQTTHSPPTSSTYTPLYTPSPAHTSTISAPGVTSSPASFTAAAPSTSAFPPPPPSVPAPFQPPPSSSATTHYPPPPATSTPSYPSPPQSKPPPAYSNLSFAPPPPAAPHSPHPTPPANPTNPNAPPAEGDKDPQSRGLLSGAKSFLKGTKKRHLLLGGAAVVGGLLGADFLFDTMAEGGGGGFDGGGFDGAGFEGGGDVGEGFTAADYDAQVQANEAAEMQLNHMHQVQAMNAANNAVMQGMAHNAAMSSI